jgi:hypothetical protein
MRRVLPVLLVVALVGAGCGSSSKHGYQSSGTPQVHFAKTKFAIHAGLAFGVFHHFIYRPFQKGDFAHPFRHKFELLKALAAGAFVVHEVRIAREDARSSKILSKVVVPLIAVGGTVALIHSALAHHRSPPASDVNTANADVSAAESASHAAGQPISETTAGAPI